MAACLGFVIVHKFPGEGTKVCTWAPHIWAIEVSDPDNSIFVGAVRVTAAWERSFSKHSVV